MTSTILPNISSLEKKIFNDSRLQEKFLEDGFLVLDETINDEGLAYLTGFFVQNKDRYGRKTYISTIELKDLEHRAKANELFKYVTKPIADKYLYNYKQFYGGYGVKLTTADDSILSTHIDTTMVPYEGNRTGITMWIPLIDVNETNGCVHVVRGSHKYHRLPRAQRCSFPYQDYVDVIEKNFMEPVPVKRGQVFIMDQSLIHRSGPNNSEYVRVAAMGMFKPEEEKLVYYNRVSENSEVDLEVYEVEDDFYLRHMLSTTPKEGNKTHIYKNDRKPYLWFDQE
ncbi:MAG: phytanoyl-CoA dioxygenase family protein [Cyclobacteriaceae bacterium]